MDSVCVALGGSLAVLPGAKLHCVTLISLGNVLLDRCDLVIRNQPFDFEVDPEQWLHGVVGLWGKLWVSGAKVTSEDPEGVRGHCISAPTKWPGTPSTCITASGRKGCRRMSRKGLSQAARSAT